MTQNLQLYYLYRHRFLYALAFQHSGIHQRDHLDIETLVSASWYLQPKETQGYGIVYLDTHKAL